MEYILRLEHLTKRYQKGPMAVDGIDLSIREGEVFAFLGPNGAGKSTTIRMIAGLCRPTSGSIVFGASISGTSGAHPHRIGLVSQHYSVDPDLSGYENLMIHAMLHGFKKKTIECRMRDLLELSELAPVSDMLVSAYSGGMKRKLQIIRSILHDPAVLILDEPTAGLDPASREKIWNLIRTLNRQGKTIIFSTHYVEEAQYYADRVAIIHRGKTVKLDSPKSLIEELGSWCRETFEDGETIRNHFRTKQEAENFSGRPYQSLTIRKTRLVDVFFDATGEKEFL